MDGVIIAWFERQRSEQIKEAERRIKRSLEADENGGRTVTFGVGNQNTTGLPPIRTLAPHFSPPPPIPRYLRPSVANHQGHRFTPFTPNNTQQHHPVSHSSQQHRTIGHWNVDPGRPHPRYSGQNPKQQVLAPGPLYASMQQPQHRTSDLRSTPHTSGMSASQPSQSAGIASPQYTCNEIRRSNTDYHGICGQTFHSAMMLEDHKRVHHGSGREREWR